MLNAILFYDDRGRWWTPGNYLTKVIDSSSEININNHGVTPEDIGILSTLDASPEKVDFILVVDSGKTQHKLHHYTEIIHRTGVKTAIWLSDTHMDYADRKRWVSEFRYDFVFVAQKDAIPKIISDCKYNPEQVVWLPHAVDTDVFFPNSAYQKRYDAVSVGFMNPVREKLFPVISSLINFKHRSTIWAWSVNKAYGEGHIGVNLPVLNDPLNMRCFEIGACRMPQIIGYPKDDPNGLFDLFKDGEDLMAFPVEDEGKLKDIVATLMIDKDLRERLAENLYQKVIKQHTYKNRMNTMLKTMGFEELA